MKKEFAAVVFHPKYKSFIVYIAVLNVNLCDKVYPSKKAQIAHLKADEASTKVLSKYINFADVLSSKLAVELPKYTRFNNHAI